MRKSTRAALMGEYLEKDQASPLAQLDPEFAGMLGLARSLESVCRVEIKPDPGRQAEIKLRLLQEREALTHQAPRKESPRVEDLLRPVLRERRRYAYAGVATLVVLAMLAVSSFWFLGKPGPEPPGPEKLLALTLNTGGMVEVRDLEGVWREAGGTFELQAGEAVRTAADRAEVRVGEAALFRMDYHSEVEISGLGPDSLALSLGTGRAYHRINLPVLYSVNVGSVNCSARGTAFDTERNGESGLLVLATQHDTRIGQGGQEVTLTQGNQYTDEDVNQAGQPGVIAPISLEGLDLDWLRYNLDLDNRQGWDPGVLPEITVEPPPPPSPEDPGTVTLRGSEGEKGAVLDWQVTGAEPQAFEVLRSQSVKQPTSPANLYKTLNNPGARSFTDTACEKGVTYYYRVAKLVNGQKILSNAVTVTTRAPEPPPPPPVEPVITLTGYQVRDLSSGLAVQLKWFLEGDLQVDGWMVCRTSGSRDPTYPPTGTDMAVPVPYASTHQGYLDNEGLYTGYTYRYRIAAMYQGKVVLYSNTFSVEIMTIVPY